MNDYCIHCTRDLDEGIDVDPNGDLKGCCAQCEAEQAIDFDVYPNATVSRSGRVELNENRPYAANLRKEAAKLHDEAVKRFKKL